MQRRRREEEEERSIFAVLCSEAQRTIHASGGSYFTLPVPAFPTRMVGL
ncbi:MAG: hypothetical protein GXP26_12280 [Planctomycetes bacterium]|nr:hypothetical protein [Planctomycetota bacterium]